jgi:hypothetical protein
VLGYQYHGIAAYIYPNQIPGTIPIYSYYKKANSDHFVGITSDTVGIAAAGYTQEHVIGYVYPNQIPGSIPFYSYVNDATGHHFYTITRAEVEPASKY